MCSTFDMESLFTDVNTQYALEVNMDLLDKNTCCARDISLWDIPWMIETVLQANVFQYTGVQYGQESLGSGHHVGTHLGHCVYVLVNIYLDSLFFHCAPIIPLHR